MIVPTESPKIALGCEFERSCCCNLASPTGFEPASRSGLVKFREMQHKPEFMKSAGGGGIAILSPVMRAGASIRYIELSKSVYRGNMPGHTPVCDAAVR